LIIQIIHRFDHFESQISRQLRKNSHCSNLDHQYFLKSFDFFVLSWRVRDKSLRADFSHFHEILVLNFQRLFVVHSYKSNDLLVSDLNRFEKFSNYRKNVVFSKMSINKVYIDLKTNKMIESIIIIIFLDHRNKIVLDSIQWMIDRFFLIDSMRHQMMFLDKNTRFALIVWWCWLEIVNLDLIHCILQMRNRFRFEMF
jgi:hypothetical protein